jgi:hypothetical protein
MGDAETLQIPLPRKNTQENSQAPHLPSRKNIFMFFKSQIYRIFSAIKIHFFSSLFEKTCFLKIF